MSGSNPFNPSPSGRRPSFRGVFSRDVTQGVERVRKWPKPRGRAKTKAEKDRQEHFSNVQRAAKYMAPGIVSDFAAACKGTPLMPRDLLTSMMYGRLAKFIMEDGRILWPVVAQTDVSQALDTLTQTEGDILIRGPSKWGPLHLADVLPTLIGSATIYRNGNYGPSVLGWQRYAFNAVDYDAPGWADLPANGIRVPEPGLYVVTMQGGLTGTGMNASRIAVNGAPARNIGPNVSGTLIWSGGTAIIRVTAPNSLITGEAYFASGATILGGLPTAFLQVTGPF